MKGEHEYVFSIPFPGRFRATFSRFPGMKGEGSMDSRWDGRSGALQGYTSEQLRYAKLVATPDIPAPAHLLAPYLVVLFNEDAAFSTGSGAPVLEDILVHSHLQEGGSHGHSQLQALPSG